ncbi:MAG: response regulator [Bacteroidales bacterium]|nr:response regulator [Bacteroidales bacterium]
MDKTFQDKLNVLIVEDNDLNAKFADAILRKYDFNIDFATNGSIAIEKFLNNFYDLILMDIQMPLMNGIEASQHIRNYEKQLAVEKPVVIIAVTAFALEHDRENCIASGMNDYLTKPYTPSELTNTIKKFFK